MVTHLPELLCWSALALALLLHLCQRSRLAARDRSRGETSLPPVSVLKPLKGADPDLANNLECFFGLDYPDYELVLGVQDPSDPAIAVVRDVAARHPDVATRLVVGGGADLANPKVENLANMLPEASHQLLLISDSNVAVEPEYLRRMVPLLLAPRVGMVTSVIRGVGGRGLGGVLEALQLNTFVMGGVALADAVGRVAAVGKSMLFRRSDLARIGGFARLGRYLAEDQVAAEAIHALGLEVVLSPWPVDNVLGRLGMRGFADRHLRWARIRRRMAPAAYVGEIVSNPAPWALLAMAVTPGVRSLAIFALALGVMSLLAWGSERRLGIRRNPLVYPLLEFVRGIVVALLWAIPFASAEVGWRGRRFRIGHRTRLLAVADEEFQEAWTSGEELRAGRAAA